MDLERGLPGGAGVFPTQPRTSCRTTCNVSGMDKPRHSGRNAHRSCLRYALVLDGSRARCGLCPLRPASLDSGIVLWNRCGRQRHYPANCRQAGQKNSGKGLLALVVVCGPGNRDGMDPEGECLDHHSLRFRRDVRQGPTLEEHDHAFEHSAVLSGAICLSIRHDGFNHFLLFPEGWRIRIRKRTRHRPIPFMEAWLVGSIGSPNRSLWTPWRLR